MSYVDKTITCRDCGTAFTFTAGEQEFYAQKGFMNEPTRCPACRQSRKAAGGGGGRDRGGFSGNDRGGYSGGGGYSSDGGGYSSDGGGGYSSGGNRSGGGGYSSGGSRERVQHETTCASCGKSTTVPFVPRGDRPVYCSDCFADKRSNSRW